MTVDWRPDAAEARAWTIAGLVITVLALPLFALPSVLTRHSGSITINLAVIAAVVALTFTLALVHEAVHGVVMLAFGARPSFGMVLVAGSMPALYATSPGHRFTRAQYLAVAAGPALLISSLGLWATSAAWGLVLVFPLAAHLGGCVGDAAAIRNVVRQPRGTLYEDLKDGVRFHLPEGA